MSRSIPVVPVAIILVSLTATGARADLAISLSNVTMAPGGTGTMDITATSDNSDALSSFNLELLITQKGATASLLQFDSSTQPDFSTNPNYVFFGGSVLGPAFWSLPPLTTNYQYDTITGGDTSALGPVVVPSTPGAPGTLLASVQFMPLIGALPTDQFQVSLVNNPAFTNFNGGSLNYTSSVGVVSIAGVPEPSSMAVVVLSGLSGLLWCYWRGRKPGQSKKNSPQATSIDPRWPV